MDFNGKVLWSKKVDHLVKALASEVGLTVSKDKLAGSNYDPEKSFISAKLVDGKGCVLSSNELYFKLPKELKYIKANIQTELIKQGDHYALKITSTTLAPKTGKNFGNKDVSLSDNYIDILPNEPVFITVKSPRSIQELKKSLTVTSLNQL